jgi:hypothetical protein
MLRDFLGAFALFFLGLVCVLVSFLIIVIGPLLLLAVMGAEEWIRVLATILGFMVWTAALLAAFFAISES